MNATNPNYGWLSRKPRSHTLSRGHVGGINPYHTTAPSEARGRAVIACFAIKSGDGAVARCRLCGRDLDRLKGAAAGVQGAGARCQLSSLFGFLSPLLAFHVLP
ncbi:hypothetical protein PIB30_077754 [Stylosanthes scabra]|uniref:Uncharacterized protein n=1 Tax=Stylosanthes scabra TaxID=79078 RepID=A0ABU6XNL9_9FABA|nr:hypothetical protein [Stylosanthes scabra]